MKKILITGTNSYIGTSLETWLKKEPENYRIDTISVREDKWKSYDFSSYDTVFHVAGIAHVSTDPKMKELYYKVNRDLTVEVAKKAKSEGVKQFIFMSSIIVYGDSLNDEYVIRKETVPKPSNFYGESKLQAEKGLLSLKANGFNIVILRPPMIYGKKSKGNYPRLASLAKRVPFFPDFNNKRSMLHIDNLCEFIKIMIDYEENGYFYPQNKEYVKTSDMVKYIAKTHGKDIKFTTVFSPIIKMFLKVNIVNKVFGTLVYDKNMSKYNNKDYQIVDFKESIDKTELF